MNRTGLSYHPDCLKHQPFHGKPEVAGRITATLEHFRQSGLLDKLKAINPLPATAEDVESVHTEELVNYVRELSEKGYEEDAIINGDVWVSPGTYEAALASAGCVKAAAKSVWEGKVDNCFALSRPPGHHASRNMPAGFCYFNNTAAAIAGLEQEYGVERVAIFDWDAHCGHGTMQVFYENPDVLTISIHQDPHSFYPGTGFVEQTGEGDGKGYCMNVPVPAGTGNADYTHVLDDFVVPKLKQFEPDIIFVAAGQDSHADDLMSGLKLTDECYGAMTGTIMDAAKKLCKGRLVLTLEGGYDLVMLPRVHHMIVSTLLGGKRPGIEGEVLQSTRDVLAQLRKHLAHTRMGD
jgi:acetoin utilization deacetylase AcuC-like enzyme